MFNYKNNNKIISIFGGSGFVGSATAQELINNGYIVQIITRDKEASSNLQTMSNSGFLNIIEWDYSDFTKITEIIQNNYAVIYAIGLLYENKKGDFNKFHHQIPLKLARIADKNNVNKFIYISALGVDKINDVKYCNSKISGEKSILSTFEASTIIRPSIIFGHNDSFFNRFAKDLKRTPICPIINGGKTKFQPIFVGDIAKIISQIINTTNKNHNGKIYEVSGPKIYSFKELMNITANYLDRHIYFANLSFFQAKILAKIICLFTKKILTAEQVDILKYDNIANNQNFIKIFNINPIQLESIVPEYIKK
jgi:uncharacterized protein YbjT (DUF2867 family)